MIGSEEGSMRDSLALHPAFGRDRGEGTPRVRARGLPLRNVMSDPPIGVDVQMRLETAYALMQQRAVTDVLVYDADRFVGVLSEHAVVAHLHGRADTRRDLPARTPEGPARVFRAMAFGPVSTAEMSVAAAAALMLHHHVTCLPVQSASGRVIGVVTQRDLIHLLI